MRAIFSIVSLLVVLAIVGVLVKRQLQATGQTVNAAVPAASGAANVVEQSSQVQQQIKSDVGKLLDQGARKDEAGQ